MSPGRIRSADEARGTHVLGGHVEIVIRTARRCYEDTHTHEGARALLDAVLQCIELVGGMTEATKPRAASPAYPVMANRTRSSQRQAAPMNPVQHHYGGGRSGRPPGDSDAGYWRHEYERVSNLHDRCEVVRRAADYLAGLIARDPHAPSRVWTEQDQIRSALLEGRGWPPADVAIRFHLTERTVALARIEEGQHPLTGQVWSAPDENLFAAQEARNMRAAGMANADIATALRRSASTVREWTTSRRRAA